MITLAFKGDKQLLSRLDKMPHAVQEALRIKIVALSLKLENLVKTGKLNGQVLNRITGRLARSISHKVIVTGTSVRGTVFSSGDVKYAAIHEFGGTINHPGGTAYIVNPKKEHLLMFVSNADAKAEMPRTKPHQIKMPQRSYMRSSLRQMSTEISSGMKKAVVQAAKG